MKRVFFVVLIGAFCLLNGVPVMASTNPGPAPSNPCVEIEKFVTVDGANWLDADTADQAPMVGDIGATYVIKIHNCGNVDLTDVKVVDEDLGIYFDLDDPLQVGKAVGWNRWAPGFENLYQPNRCDPPDPYKLNTATVTAVATIDGAQVSVNDQDVAWVKCQDIAKNEGCTPGYWKQDQHFDSWVGFAPDQKFSAVFERVISVKVFDKKSDPKLNEALMAQGGGVNALARHAVAALLNAANPGVAYRYSVEEVISMFQTGYDAGNYEMTKNLFEMANESLCPLN